MNLIPASPVPNGVAKVRLRPRPRILYDTQRLAVSPRLSEIPGSMRLVVNARVFYLIDSEDTYLQRAKEKLKVCLGYSTRSKKHDIASDRWTCRLTVLEIRRGHGCG
jgi:hypothetical protein